MPTQTHAGHDLLLPPRVAWRPFLAAIYMLSGAEMPSRSRPFASTCRVALRERQARVAERGVVDEELVRVVVHVERGRELAKVMSRRDAARDSGPPLSTTSG